MQKFSSSPRAMLTSFWFHRNLIMVFSRREILGRYRGSILGLLWSFFNPLFMLAVYTFIFSEVFKTRWTGGGGSRAEFALLVFSGLIVLNLFSECINRAPSLILSNVNYVKKVVFPLEILPYVTLFSGMYHLIISVLVWLIAYMIFFGAPRITALYLPLLLLPFCFFIMGLSWALASLGVYLRDVSQFIGMVVMAMMFLSPIFYPATALPEAYQHLFFLNPLTPVIEMMRDVIFWGKPPSLELLITYWVSTIIVAWAGFAWFQKTRKGFADVL